jgi:hypothetical protein
MEEIWTSPRGGVMLGLHRDVSPSGKSFFEFLRISVTETEVVYHASPMGRDPTPFSLKSLGDQQAVFENLEHDYPQRIIYRREGDRLHARIEGERDGALQSSEWVWRRTVAD